MSLENKQTNNNGAPFSLIKYEAQIEISDNLEQYQKAKNNQKILDSRPSPEDVLNNMIIPRQWSTPQNKHFMQYVSHQKAERDDVVVLKEELDKALQHKQARPQGICPIREELFSQTFDQIIRQVSINCPQRGLLLMRVKDEHIMTLAAYQTLYQTSINYGMRKLLESEQGMDEIQMELSKARQQKDKFQNKKVELELKKKSLNKKIQERILVQNLYKEDQILQIQQQQTALVKYLNSLKEPKTQ